MAYIERDIFINNELIPLVKTLDLCHLKQKKGVLMAISKLKEAPAADVVDVVRCKDCKNLMFSETQSRTKQAPEGYKVNPEFIETKTKRVQLLLQPSVVDAIKALAKRQGLSMNEAISQAIQEYVEKNNG